MVTYLNLDSSVASARPLFAMRAAILIRPHAADRRYINLPTRSKHAHCCGTTRVGLTEQAPAMTATANSMYPHEPEAKELIAELCKLFYDQGWVSGTGGGISIRCGEDRLAMAPSGVQKERMRTQDMFVLDLKGNELVQPESRPPPYKPPKLSAVMHSHSQSAVLATLLDPSASEFRCTHLEMMKGIAGHGFYDTMVVPIIENTARECELTDRMREAIKAYPKTSAVLVRRHGVYVWGRTWIEAKTQAECYDYLFGAAVRMAGMGISPSLPPAALPLKNGKATNGVNGASTHIEAADTEGPTLKRARVVTSRQPKCVVLDIEGTVVPITFVTETLFPYANSHLKSFLDSTFENPETQKAVSDLRAQAASDVAVSVTNIQEIVTGAKEDVIKSVVANVETQMAVDRKSTALKYLQGLIWTQGFRSGELKGNLYRDVPDALQLFRNMGIKSYIYSSGSRRAQRDLFGHTQVGDLRPYLMGFFDTNSGSKREAASYTEIAASLAVDSAEEILFATDIVEEAQAAKAAGWECVLVNRPGNKALPSDHGFPVIDSMDKLLDAY